MISVNTGVYVQEVITRYCVTTKIIVILTPTRDWRWAVSAHENDHCVNREIWNKITRVICQQQNTCTPVRLVSVSLCTNRRRTNGNVKRSSAHIYRNTAVLGHRTSTQSYIMLYDSEFDYNNKGIHCFDLIGYRIATLILPYCFANKRSNP